MNIRLVKVKTQDSLQSEIDQVLYHEDRLLSIKKPSNFGGLFYSNPIYKWITSP